jgi:hypothetical protein
MLPRGACGPPEPPAMLSARASLRLAVAAIIGRRGWPSFAVLPQG